MYSFVFMKFTFLKGLVDLFPYASAVSLIFLPPFIFVLRAMLSFTQLPSILPLPHHFFYCVPTDL